MTPFHSGTGDGSRLGGSSVYSSSKGKSIPGTISVHHSHSITSEGPTEEDIALVYVVYLCCCFHVLDAECAPVTYN